MQFDLFEEPVFGAAHIPIRAEDSKGLDSGAKLQNLRELAGFLDIGAVVTARVLIATFGLLPCLGSAGTRTAKISIELLYKPIAAHRDLSVRPDHRDQQVHS